MGKVQRVSVVTDHFAANVLKEDDEFVGWVKLPVVYTQLEIPLKSWGIRIGPEEEVPGAADENSTVFQGFTSF